MDLPLVARKLDLFSERPTCADGLTTQKLANPWGVRVPGLTLGSEHHASDGAKALHEEPETHTYPGDGRTMGITLDR